MAKNDKKDHVQPVEDKKPEGISAPEKVIASATPKPEQTPHKPPHPTEPPHKKSHGWRKLVLFIILLLAGAVGYLTVQLRQTEKINDEALQKLQSAYDAKINEINTRVSLLNQEVIGLKSRPIVEHAAGISENQLNQKLAALRAELEHQFGISEETPEETTAEPTEETAEKPAKPAVTAEIAATTPNEKTTQELLLASGAIIVRDLAEQGVNFAYEAEVLQILAQGNELAERNTIVIRSYANSGITGKHKLIRNFHKIFAELNTAELKSQPKPETTEQPQKWYQKAWCWLKQQVTAKKQPKKPVFTPQKDEVLQLVDEGRIKDALDALSTSEKYAKINSEPLQQWRIQATRYLNFDDAINALIINSLANIRLKEMEH